MFINYLKLGIAAFLPAIFSVIIYLVDKKTAFGKMNKAAKQIIIGIVFGALAIVGTEWGIPINGAQVNCRDAAVLSAGLLFGAPAGIIAGVIGAVERWIAVAWGVGTFTRVACTVSTFIAGIYAALLRKFMFENKKPGWLISMAIGVVMEIFHLTMVFLTNMDDPSKAIGVVLACTVPMVTANGISVMLGSIFITLAAKERLLTQRREVNISQIIQRWLLVCVVLAFVVTTNFMISLQNNLTDIQSTRFLEIAIGDITADIAEASDKNLIDISKEIKDDLSSKSIDELMKEHDVAEINLVDKNGIITKSTNPNFIGFDMKSGEQSKEFMTLLTDKTEYAQSYGPISYNDQISRKYAGVRTDDGFVQVGYDAEHFQNDISNLVKGFTHNRHVGETGYVIIADKDCRIVSAPNTTLGKKASEIGLDFDVDNLTENKKIEKNIAGEDCYLMYDKAEGYYIISVYPMGEAFRMKNVAIYVNAYMEILVFAVMFAMIYVLIKRVVVNKMREINESLSQITNGNMNVVVNVRSNAEFASLSDDINSTVETLKHYIDEASARIDKELEFAKSIQLSALPRVFPAFPKRKDFDIYATMSTAKEVGGDFYDFYFTGEDMLNFLVADVSGKGIPAAMFMMRAKSELKGHSETGMPINEAVTLSNNGLCEGNEAGMFVTAWQGSVDLKTGLVQFVNAGHNPPLVKRNGKFEYLKTRAGLVLAGMEGIKYRTQEIQLEPGDMIYLYTDGVTEATDSNEKLYGEERLLMALNSADTDDVKEICEIVKADVDKFVGEADQFDDMTMLSFKYYGPEQPETIRFERAQISDIPQVTEFIEGELEKRGCSMKTIARINIVIDEIYSNIAKFAYKDGDGPVTVSLKEKQDPHRIVLRFVDEGVPYNPLTKEDPDVSLDAESRDIGGLGVFMVKKIMDDVSYKYKNDKNILTLVKNI